MNFMVQSSNSSIFCKTNEGDTFDIIWVNHSTYLSNPTGIFHLNGHKLKIINHMKTNFIVINAKEVIITEEIKLESFDTLEIIAQEDITFQSGAKIISSIPLYLKSGIENSEGQGRVVFKDTAQKQIYMENNSRVHIYYNPAPSEGLPVHKYQNPYVYFKHVEPSRAATAYMLVNNIDDLQNIRRFLHGNYALSQNIDASVTKEWKNGFTSLSLKEKNMPFSGNFDGNGYMIKNLFISMPEEKNVGLFGVIAGQKHSPAIIKNLHLSNVNITGDHYVGGISGDAEYALFENLNISSYHITGRGVVGGIIGTGTNLTMRQININKSYYPEIIAEEYKGLLAGSMEEADLYNMTELCADGAIQCIGAPKHINFEDL